MNFSFEKFSLYVTFPEYAGYDHGSQCYGLFTISVVTVSCLFWQKLKVEKAEDDKTDEEVMGMKMEKVADSSAYA